MNEWMKGMINMTENEWMGEMLFCSHQVTEI